MRHAVWRNAIFEGELKLSWIHGFRVYAFREVTTRDTFSRRRNGNSLSSRHI
jgi:hypothetical protein